MDFSKIFIIDKTIHKLGIFLNVILFGQFLGRVKKENILYTEVADEQIGYYSKYTNFPILLGFIPTSMKEVNNKIVANYIFGGKVMRLTHTGGQLIKNLFDNIVDKDAPIDLDQMVNMFMPETKAKPFSPYYSLYFVALKVFVHNIELPFIKVVLDDNRLKISFKRMCRMFNNSSFLFTEDITFRDFIMFYLFPEIKFRNHSFYLLDKQFVDYVTDLYWSRFELDQNSLSKINDSVVKFLSSLTFSLLRLFNEDITLSVELESFTKNDIDQNKKKALSLIEHRLKYFKNNPEFLSLDNSLIEIQV